MSNYLYTLGYGGKALVYQINDNGGLTLKDHSEGNNGDMSFGAEAGAKLYVIHEESKGGISTWSWDKTNVVSTTPSITKLQVCQKFNIFVVFHTYLCSPSDIHSSKYVASFHNP